MTATLHPRATSAATLAALNASQNGAGRVAVELSESALNTPQMRSGDDVQRALALAGAEIANRYDGLTLPAHIGGTIHDSNGTPVGEWRVTDKETA